MYQRLKNYRILKAQLERIARAYPELNEGGEIADKMLREEYERISKELYELDRAIYSIQDECIRAIAIRHFIFGDAYEKIGAEFVFYSKEGCRKKLIQYFEKVGEVDE